MAFFYFFYKNKYNFQKQTFVICVMLKNYYIGNSIFVQSYNFHIDTLQIVKRMLKY